VSPEQPDYYATLGIPATATPRQITHAYRALVRTLHPDTATATATAPGDTGTRFAAVTAAYAVLHDPARRAAYDETRRTPPRTSTTIHVTFRPTPAHDATTAGPPTQRDTLSPPLRVGPTRVSPLPHRGP
jgi:DnaJ-class molecular chaperone